MKPNPADDIKVYTQGETIFYTGPMYLPGAERFIAAIESADHPISTLVINSSGGDIEAGMMMGEVVLERELNVRVDGECFSSCANYILTTASSITLEDDSAYGWHGGAYQPAYFPLTEEFFPGFKEYFYKMQPRETALFEKAGVYQAVTVLPMLPEFGAERDAAVYTFDPATLRQLGLHALAKADPKGEPRCFMRREKELCTQVFTLEREHVELLLSTFNDDKAKWDTWLAEEIVNKTDAVAPPQ